MTDLDVFKSKNPKQEFSKKLHKAMSSLYAGVASCKK